MTSLITPQNLLELNEVRLLISWSFFNHQGTVFGFMHFRLRLTFVEGDTGVILVITMELFVLFRISDGRNRNNQGPGVHHQPLPPYIPDEL
ncbi:hypothetical protein AWC38_SpisGene2897 [Stylophora pistillata]|uniref:Uncharacterized protein n=1 Tax=Stylophora pistillata TaxID=50429 RepID=A0A2B4ST83_STYPI|nr:hypothetical protein AWC38_SpisGene2897 [Stylophora pistillata]